MILNPLKIAFLNKRGLNNLNTKILWVANFSSLSLSVTLSLFLYLYVEPDMLKTPARHLNSG